MSIRWRLFASYLLVVVLAALLLGVLVARATEQRYLATLRDSLRSQATLIADLTRADLARGKRSAALTARVRALDHETGLRVTLIAPGGAVLADSEYEAATMENHGTRTEVSGALASGTGTDIRRSRTLRANLLYLAVRAPREGTPVGVVRVAVPLRQVQAAFTEIRDRVFVFGVISVLLALLLSLRFSHRLTSAVSDLTRAARGFSGGNLEAHAHPHGRDELTALAESFNEMARRVRTTMREVQEEKQQAETILARLGEAVLVTDGQGRLIRCNQAAERVFGVSTAQALGRGVADVTQSHALDAAFRQALGTGETTAVELQVLFPRAAVLEATVTVISDGQPMGAVAVLHDVTELRRLEAVRREFVSNASHELQTPVTAIRAMAETLLAGGKEDGALLDRFLPEVEQQADRLAALVRDLLDLARIEAGPLPLQLAEIGVADVVSGLLRSFAPLASQRGITLQSEVPPDLVVEADWSSLHRLLANLLDNAIKYTEPGGQVGVRGATRDGRAEITVWDTGLGLASSDQPRIFERFYRVDKARSLRLGGTGLGLSIVKHLTEAMEGTITVRSELGQGSEFVVTLPRPQA